VSDGPGSVRVIVFGDESLGLIEDVLAEVVLFNGSVRKTMLGDVLHEGLFRSYSGALDRSCTNFITLEDGGGERLGIIKSVASGRHSRAQTPGALSVGITRRFVSENIEARVSFGGCNCTEDSDSEQRAHFLVKNIIIN
jgi:hypothetical protein